MTSLTVKDLRLILSDADDEAIVVLSNAEDSVHQDIEIITKCDLTRNEDGRKFKDVIVLVASKTHSDAVPFDVPFYIVRTRVS